MPRKPSERYSAVASTIVGSVLSRIERKPSARPRWARICTRRRSRRRGRRPRRAATDYTNGEFRVRDALPKVRLPVPALESSTHYPTEMRKGREPAGQSQPTIDLSVFRRHPSGERGVAATQAPRADQSMTPTNHQHELLRVPRGGCPATRRKRNAVLLAI